MNIDEITKKFSASIITPDFTSRGKECIVEYVEPSQQWLGYYFDDGNYYPDSLRQRLGDFLSNDKCYQILSYNDVQGYNLEIHELDDKSLIYYIFDSETNSLLGEYFKLSDAYSQLKKWINNVNCK